MKKEIEVTDEFLYDLNMLAFSAKHLHQLLMELRTIVRTADARWAKNTAILNKEAGKRQERKLYMDQIPQRLRDLNTALFSIDRHFTELWDIDLYKCVDTWKYEQIPIS